MDALHLGALIVGTISCICMVVGFGYVMFFMDDE